MKQCIFVLGIMLMLSACKKESNTTEVLQGKYRTTNMATVSPIVMYLQNRKIYDTAIINPFLRSLNATGSFVNSATEIFNDTLLTIDFKENNLVEYKQFRYPTVSNIATIRQLNTTEIEIKNRDTLTVTYTDIGNSLDPYGSCDTLGRLTTKASPSLFFVDTVYLPNGTFGRLVSVYRFNLLQMNGVFSLPLKTIAYGTSYSYSNGFSGSCRGVMRNEWDIFPAENIESKLRVKDTLVVQTKTVALKKI
jgi:hypothetical protein